MWSADVKVCASTGLNLVSSGGRSIFRVAKADRGPVDPPLRSAERPVQGWSRWDTVGRTIYGGATAVAAFVEVLEYIRPEPPGTALGELFDDAEPGDAATLAEQVARELPAHGAMRYRSVSQGWRQDRRIYELGLPDSGWFIDISGAESIATLDAECRELLADNGVDRLTLAELVDSGDAAKPVTTGIASWLRRVAVLEDGSLPHGIAYPSRWGSNLENWAMWLRRRDDEIGEDPVSVRDSAEIGMHTAELVQASKLRGFTIF